MVSRQQRRRAARAQARGREQGIPRAVAGIALVAMLGAAVGGCQTFGLDTTGSIGAVSTEAATQAQWRQSADAWGKRYNANPRDAQAAMNYAQALRELDERAQAVAVLEQSSIENPHNMELLGAYGRALADVGRYQEALRMFARAHTPDRPDWRILSAQGAVLDQMGRHTEAQRYYATALKIVPNEPTVLSNLGLSYALAKDLKRAEQTLRRAAAQPNPDPRVRQNLALVVGLQGRFEEAEQIARADLPPEEAAANVAYLRQMLASQQKPEPTTHPPARSGTS